MPVAEHREIVKAPVIARFRLCVRFAVFGHHHPTSFGPHSDSRPSQTQLRGLPAPLLDSPLAAALPELVGVDTEAVTEETPACQWDDNNSPRYVPFSLENLTCTEI